MLRKVNQEVSYCLARADACGRKAEVSEETREVFLRLRQSWLALARSYEFGERLVDFSKENRRRRNEFYEHDMHWGGMTPKKPQTF